MFKRFYGAVLAALLLCTASAQAGDYRWDFEVSSFYGSALFSSANGYVTFSAASPQGQWSELKDFGLAIGDAHYSMSDVEYLQLSGVWEFIGGPLNGATTILAGTNDFWVYFDQTGIQGLTYSSVNNALGTWNASSFSSRLSVLPVAAPVPEPETYAMFLAGLGLMGLVARRRKA